MMFLWLLIIGGILYYLWVGEHSLLRQQSALDILKERLANGEISIQEFKRLKQLLEDKS